MSILSIDKVQRGLQNGSTPSRFQGNIDSPKVGQAFDEYALTVNGWAFMNNALPVSIDVFLQGRLVRSLAPRVPRPDITAHFARKGMAQNVVKGIEKCGFRFMIGTLATPPEWKMRLEAVAESGERFVIGSIQGRRSPLPAAPPEYLQPLFLTSLGRSGSTYLMRLMSSHPEIVALNKYPYETRSAQFHLHQARVACEPVNEKQSAQRSHFWTSPWWSGNNPFNSPLETSLPEMRQWFGKTLVNSHLNFCHQNTEEFYRLAAKIQQQSHAKYFVEKTISDPAWAFWEIYPQMREIFLVRDFRDTVCSILAFNAKRGSIGFGREKADSDTDYILRLRSQVSNLYEQWKSRSERAHLIRYEDLIDQPLSTLQKAFEYIGLEASETVIQDVLQKANEDTTELKNHRTTGSGQSSVARWKTDLSPELQDACQQSFGDILPHFDYV